MIYTFDSREVRPGMGFVALKGEKVDGHAFIPQALAAGAAEIVDGLEALQAKAREKRRAFRGKVVGVTGSAGKTTTKEFLKTLLDCPGTAGNFNNHIGLPMTILNAPDDAECLVLEMGTNHPGEIAALCDIAEPDIGVLVSVGTAHLEFFRTQRGIAEEKGVLLARAKDFGVVATTCNELETLRSLPRAGELLEVDPAALPLVCPLPGAHNASNLALAHAVARRLGLSDDVCRERLTNFALPGARWRLREKWGATFIDDSYNANPDSMIAALDALMTVPCTGRRIAVLGDMGELGDEALALHRRVFDHAMKLKLPLVIGVGRHAPDCLCHLAFETPSKLRSRLRFEIAPGDVVLLKASHAMELGKLIDD